jgi:hypothetical protein
MLPASGNKKNHVGVLASHFFHGVSFGLIILSWQGFQIFKTDLLQETTVI